MVDRIFERTFTRLPLIAAGLVFAVAVNLACATDHPSPPPPSTQPGSATTAPAGRFDARPTRPPDEEVALAFYKEFLPEAYKFVTVVKGKDLNAYNQKVKQKVIREATYLINMKFDNPKLFPLKTKQSRFNFRLSQINNDLQNPALAANDANDLKKELMDVTAQQFDVGTDIMKLQLEELQRQIEESRRHLQEFQDKVNLREKEKADLIQKQYDENLKPKSHPPGI